MVIRNATGGTCIGFVYGVNEYTKWLTERQKQAAQIRRTPPAFSWAELVVKSSEFAMVGAVVGLAVSAANGVIRWLTD